MDAAKSRHCALEKPNKFLVYSIEFPSRHNDDDKDFGYHQIDDQGIDDQGCHWATSTVQGLASIVLASLSYYGYSASDARAFVVFLEKKQYDNPGRNLVPRYQCPLTHKERNEFWLEFMGRANSN